MRVAARFYAARGVASIATLSVQTLAIAICAGARSQGAATRATQPMARRESLLCAEARRSSAPVEQLDVGRVVKAHSDVRRDRAGSSPRPPPEDRGRACGSHGRVILFRGGEPQIEAEATISRAYVEVRLRHATVALPSFQSPCPHCDPDAQERNLGRRCGIGSVLRGCVVQRDGSGPCSALPLISRPSSSAHCISTTI